MFGRSLNRDNRTDEQLLNEALTVANQSDIIIAALGESSEMSGESSSRTDLNIPDVQQNLLKELLKTGKPVVLVLFTGRPLTLTWEQEHVPAILNVWFGGSEAAYAIGDALFGYVNPGGKLTMSFPKNVGQIPLYYACLLYTSLLAEVPGISGTVPGIGNLGEIENMGVEMAASWRDQIGDWGYSVSANLTTIKNKVKSLVQDLSLIHI